MMVEALPAPNLPIPVHSRNPWAVAAALRQAMRRAGKDRREIDRCVAEALATDDPERLRELCRPWVRFQ
jgi:hypothetical protein